MKKYTGWICAALCLVLLGAAALLLSNGRRAVCRQLRALADEGISAVSLWQNREENAVELAEAALTVGEREKLCTLLQCLRPEDLRLLRTRADHVPTYGLHMTADSGSYAIDASASAPGQLEIDLDGKLWQIKSNALNACVDNARKDHITDFWDLCRISCSFGSQTTELTEAEDIEAVVSLLRGEAMSQKRPHDGANGWVCDLRFYASDAPGAKQVYHLNFPTDETVTVDGYTYDFPADQLLKALRALCTAVETVQTDAPAASSTENQPAEPELDDPPEETPTQEPEKSAIEAFLDQDEMIIRYWIFPGSGPWAAKFYVDECGDELRQLLLADNWEAAIQERRELSEEESFLETNISLYAYDGVNNIGVMLESGSAMEGVPELMEALVDLSPGPAPRIGFTHIKSMAEPKELGWQFARAFQERYENSGRIRTFRLDCVEGCWASEVRELEPYQKGRQDVPVLVLGFSVLPTEPHWRYWQDQEQDADGWVSYKYWIMLDRDEYGNVRMADLQDYPPLFMQE